MVKVCKCYKIAISEDSYRVQTDTGHKITATKLWGLS